MCSLAFAGQASAQYVNPPPPGGAGTDSQTLSGGQRAVEVSDVGGSPASSRDSFAVTGGDVLGLAAMGAGAVVVGGAVLAVRRRSGEA